MSWVNFRKIWGMGRLWTREDSLNHALRYSNNTGWFNTSHLSQTNPRDALPCVS